MSAPVRRLIATYLLYALIALAALAAILALGEAAVRFCLTHDAVREAWVRAADLTMSALALIIAVILALDLFIPDGSEIKTGTRATGDSGHARAARGDAGEPGASSPPVGR